LSQDQSWIVSIHPQVIKFIEKHLSPEDQVRVLDLFDRLETYATELGWPYTRQIEGKLWELRPQTTRGTWRFLYIIVPERRFCVVVAMRKRARIDAKVKKTAWGRLAYFDVEA
jgi:phage-related protein